jgi:hypothetical protein
MKHLRVRTVGQHRREGFLVGEIHKIHEIQDQRLTETFLIKTMNRCIYE